MNFTRAVVQRPIFTLMIVLGVLVAGVMAWRSSRVELNPDVSLGFITIVTPYPGAGPGEVDNEVSRRIEDAIGGVSGLRQVTSTSQEGVSVVLAEFQLGIDTEKALTDIRASVDKIANDLPKEVRKSVFDKVQEGATPILTVALQSSKLDSRTLRTLAAAKIIDRLRRIPGVARATIEGGKIRELGVQLHRDRMIAAGVGVLDIQRQLQAASANTPAGQIEQGGTEIALRVPAAIELAEQLEAIPISVTDSTAPGSARFIPLAQVATVVDGSQEPRAFARLSGRDTVTMAIQRTREGNAVEIADAVTTELQAIQRDFAAEGLEFSIIDNQATEIGNSLKDLTFDIWFAIALVCGTIYLFLHNLRGAAIVAVAIPVRLVTSLLVMRAFGVTINSLSLIGLTLAIAVLVDDAIVVLENIYRHLRLGESPTEAALNGRAEIGMAAIAITLADVVVFLPLAFIGGIVGMYLRPLAIAFVSAVLISLLVSFTLTPLLASRWYRAGEDLEHPTGRFARGFELAFERLTQNYGRVLDWSLHHRWGVFLAGNLTLAGVFTLIAASSANSLGEALATGLIPFALCSAVGVVVFLVQLLRKRKRPRIILGGLMFGLGFLAAAGAGFYYGQWKGDDLFKFSFLPEADGNRVSIDVKLSPGASLSETDRVVRAVEARLIGQTEVKNVISTLGSQNNNSGANLATLDVLLRTKASPKDVLLGLVAKENLRTKSSKEVIFGIQKQLPVIPGADIRVRSSSGDGFGPPIQVSLTGGDVTQLRRVAKDLVTKLRGGVVPGLTNPDTNLQEGKLELQVKLDRDRLALAGLDAVSAGDALRTLYEGDDSNKIRRDGTEYAIRLQLAKADRQDREALASIPVSFSEGAPIYLSSIASFKSGQATSKIERRNGVIEVTLSADLLPGNSAGTVQAKFDEWLRKPGVLEPGISVKALGQQDFQNQEVGGLVLALLIGVTLVYMLLASLYENLVYPFIIQLCQPQAMVGALLALVITDTPFDIVGFIGLLTLVGLVGKNAILLVDYANTLRAQGFSRHEALIRSGETRLRPIAMTTMALILGILPIALALGRGGEGRAGIGIVIIGGTLLSTVLTLLVIPCSYTLIDDLAGRFRRKSRTITGSETSPNQ